MTNSNLKAAFDRLNNAIGKLDAVGAQASLRQSAAALSQVQATAEISAEGYAKHSQDGEFFEKL